VRQSFLHFPLHPVKLASVVLFKVLIVLLWAIVPLAAALLIRSDIQRFEGQSESQRTLAAGISAELSRHAAAVVREARRINRHGYSTSLLQWRREWQHLRRNIEASITKLESADLGYCPATSSMLQEQQATLKRLIENVESCARDQEYLQRSEAVLEQAIQEQRLLRFYSRQYQHMPGGRGIYLNLQEELAKQETRFQVQQRERNRLQQAVQEQLSEIEQTERALQSALSRCTFLLAQDASQTYLDDIRDRWERFSLRDELTRRLAALADTTTYPAR
jgi:hypothetical protein